jgi:hypothetical protein
MTDRLRKERMCGMYGPTGEHDSTGAALQAYVRADVASSGGQTGAPPVDTARQGVDFDQLPEQLADYVSGLQWVDHAVPGASLALLKLDHGCALWVALYPPFALQNSLWQVEL